MKSLVLLYFLFFAVCCSAQSFSVQDLKNGKNKTDSSYIYTLPFASNKKVWVAQAYESMFSHKGERAIDFKVKKGTIICAARAGVVTAIRKDSDKGGLQPENMADGNYIIIRHDDGSSAYYWHLQKDGVIVSVGDTVQCGTQIGYSGNTGYSAFPHLHFEVQGLDANDQFVQLPTRFYTQKGIVYLRPRQFYKTLHP